jgi:hypothetical protein
MPAAFPQETKLILFHPRDASHNIAGQVAVHAIAGMHKISRTRWLSVAVQQNLITLLTEIYQRMIVN